jgi:type IV secretory pathway VirB2 component (pilin)
MAVAVVLVATDAFAQIGGSPFEALAQRIVLLLTGTLARLIAIIAFFFSGFKLATGDGGNRGALVTVLFGSLVMIFAAPIVQFLFP